MNDKEIYKEYLKKIKLIQKYNQLYYNKNKSDISDSQFDILKKEVLELEKKYSFLKNKSSPSLTVGFKPSKNFKKVKHKVPMLSLGNAFNEEDLLNFEKKIFNFLNLKKGFENQKIVKYKDLPKFRPLICYESIFPGKFIKNENDPILLVNFTNDAWFGNTIGPYQHFVNSKFRAIEEVKHLIRVANTGISSSIDPLGRVLKKLSLNSSGYFDTNIFIGNKNNIPIKTIFSKYKNNLVIVLLIILFFLLCILKYELRYRN